MAFHKKLYQLRKNNGLSQEELGEKLNVSRQTISKWELGESTPDMEKLIMLSDYFKISLDELVLENEPTTCQKDNTYSTHAMIEKFYTKENKLKIKKFLKILGYIFAIFLAIDILSLVIFAIIKFFS